MPYGIRVENTSGWLQIDESWQGMVARNIYSVNKNHFGDSSTTYTDLSDPNHTGTGNEAYPWPQLYARPNYNSWADLLAATGGGIVHCGIGQTSAAAADKGRKFTFLTNNTNISWTVLAYNSGDNWDADNDVSGWGLVVRNSAGNVTFSSTKYAPLPMTVISGSITDGGANHYDYTVGVKPPWAMINNTKPWKVREDAPGYRIRTFVTAYWNANTSKVAISTFQADPEQDQYTSDVTSEEIIKMAILKEN